MSLSNLINRQFYSKLIHFDVSITSFTFNEKHWYEETSFF